MEQSILRVSNLRSGLDRRTKEPYFILKGSQRIAVRELAMLLYSRESVLINRIKTTEELVRLIKTGKL